MHIYSCTCSFASRQCICQGFSQMVAVYVGICCLFLRLLHYEHLCSLLLLLFCFLSTIAVSVIVRCGQTTSRFEFLPGRTGRKVQRVLLNWQPNTLFLEILMFMVLELAKVSIDRVHVVSNLN